MKKLLAFTLAETLIVIGIIGVVSALTLPNLNSSTGEKEKVAKVKKIYQNVEDALGRAQAIYGPISEWKTLDSTATAQTTRFGNRLTEFMKLSKTCAMASGSRCMSNVAPKTLNNGTAFGNALDTNTSAYKGILADGTSFAIIPSNTTYYFAFDIDGPNKGANTTGKDIFSFVISTTNDELVVPSPSVTFSAMTTGWGEAVTNWVVNFDNMDYLKANASNGKCNSGNVTLNAAANPPVTQCN